MTEKTRVGLYLPADLLAQLDKSIPGSAMSRNQLITMILQKWLHDGANVVDLFIL